MTGTITVRELINGNPDRRVYGTLHFPLHICGHEPIENRPLSCIAAYGETAVTLYGAMVSVASTPCPECKKQFFGVGSPISLDEHFNNTPRTSPVSRDQTNKESELIDVNWRKWVATIAKATGERS